MFCRFLGQSVGAAIFGAIFNAALARLRAAPPGLAGRLPHRVDQVGAALTRAAGLGQAAAGYLRAAITAAVHDVYLALALAAGGHPGDGTGARPPAVRHRARRRGQHRARREGRASRPGALHRG
jgi:hypothetical protein